MENNLHIFIDRLKNDKEEKILDTLLAKDLDIEREKELIFRTPIELEAKVYRVNEELIINVNLKFGVSIPCKICNKLIEKDIKVKNLYITEEIENIKTFYDLKDEIKNLCFLQIPSYVECLDSCPSRENIKNYFKEQKKENFPFSDLKE
ncbi:MAG: hypothetical protein KR126chlam4_00813 [Candidatus Anoxychlamydiales bacterium]|nr:hypothetical protein [Candidatus Anoxychlamydiales bacterium]NGX40981.1 hypothetical protein [Candidatus Anoxychlamydiales bacterium]